MKPPPFSELSIDFPQMHGEKEQEILFLQKKQEMKNFLQRHFPNIMLSIPILQKLFNSQAES